MSWAVLATLLAAAAGCGEPKIDAEEARAIFRATVRESSPDPARYLDRKMEPRFRCDGNRGVWIAGTYGPSGSFDDSELVVIDAISGRADHVTAPCVAPLASPQIEPRESPNALPQTAESAGQTSTSHFFKRTAALEKRRTGCIPQ